MNAPLRPFFLWLRLQTQAFHTLYHTDENVLLGAPTGSGASLARLPCCACAPADLPVSMSDFMQLSWQASEGHLSPIFV